MKKMMILLLAAVLLLAGCGNGGSTAVPELTKPADEAVMAGDVRWFRGEYPFDENIGYGGEWSLQVRDAVHFSQLKTQYALEGDENIDFSRTVLLVLFYSDYSGSEYELTQLAMLDGMATVAIHEKVRGQEGLELVGCLIETDSEPLEINSFRDEETVG